MGRPSLAGWRPGVGDEGGPNPCSWLSKYEEKSIMIETTSAVTENIIEARVEEIVIGDRHRKEVGDLDALAESIREVGLLHPVVVTPDKKLVAGSRRLAAVKKLGWTKVPVHVVRGLSDAVQSLRAERDENACRKEFAPTEVADLGRKLEELERPAAKERQAEAGPADGPGKKATASGKLPAGAAGDTRDRVAAAFGISGKTYEKIKAVVEAAKEHPEEYGKLVEQMDQTGKVDAA
jgi:ParB family chromosome partitioning protein